MTCIIIKTPNGHGFMCGEDLESYPCRDCGFQGDLLCDYPVGDDKTCDAIMCHDHGHEISPGLHYCEPHYKEWKKFVENNGVKKVLGNIVPFDPRLIK